jgi:Surface lipoprotein assembly modifier
MNTRCPGLLLALLGSAVATVAAAQGDREIEDTDAPSAAPADSGADAARPLSFEVGTGLEYDSNVAVLDLDSTADAGDTAVLLELGVDYDSAADGPLDFQTGYHFSQSLHDDFDAFDVRIHRGSAAASYDLGRLDAGASLQHAQAELDGADFLTLTQVSPYVSRLLGKRLFLRFAYAHSDKDFAGRRERDATNDSLAADAYVFVNGLTTYVVFGYRYDDENAVDAQFDYAGHKLNAQLSKRISLGARELTSKTYLRYETRDYASPTPSINAERSDDRWQLETTLELPVGERVLARFSYKHSDNRSNLPSVDFDENVVSVGFAATF